MNIRYCFLCLFLLGLFPVKAQEYDISAITLADALAIGIENNLTLKRSQLDLINTETSLLEARGQQIPTLSASSNAGYSWGRSFNESTSLFESRNLGNVSVGISSNVTLFAGRQIANSIQQAKVNIEAGRLNVAATEDDITLNIINLFVNVVLAKEQVNIAESQLKTSSQQLLRTGRLVEAGSLPLSERLDMEAQVASGEVELIRAKNNLRLAKLNLAQQLLVPFSEEFDVSVPDLQAEDYPLEQVNVTEIYGIAVETLPQVKAAELAVTSAEYGIKIAKGGFLPTLGLAGNISSNYTDPENAPEREFMTQMNDNLGQSLGLNLNIPVLSNYRNRASLQRARVQRNLSEVQEQEVKNQLRQDIETAYTNAYAARQSYQASQKQVASLEEAFRMADQRYNVGAINSVDFQVAQSNLFNAQAEMLNAKYEYIFMVKVLDFYLGKPITL